MKNIVVFIFVALLTVGTPWLALMGALSTTPLSTKDKCSMLVKGVLSGDVEERSEEEDTHETTETESETEEEDEVSFKILNDLASFHLPKKLSLIIHHQADLFREHHREILTPPPKG
ncbi:MAG: hypothetical protein ACOYW3_13720 [Bacteroidota bacterium]